MISKTEIDEIDRHILIALLKDARRPYQEIAGEIHVSTATVHGRLQRLKEMGIVSGSRLNVNFEKLGLEVTAFIGVNLASAKDFSNVLENLKMFPEVVDVHYTTGGYSMFIKVVVKTIKELHLFIATKLQGISQIQSTETLISLDNPIRREPDIPKNHL